MEKDISIIQHFEGSTLDTYPELTEVTISIHDPDFVKRFWSELVPIVRTETEQIPTAAIWEKGDWVARRFSGIKFPLIEKWLRENGYQYDNYNYSVKD